MLTRPFAALATAAALLAGSNTAASAEVIEAEHIRFSDTHIEQEEHEGFCPNVTFPVLFTGEGHAFFQIRALSDGLLHFSSNFEAHETYTNTVNGESLRFQHSFRSQDVRVTDNGDGTLTIVFHFVGGSLVFGPDGQLLFRDKGNFTETVLIDHNGTPDLPDDDIFITQLDESFHGIAESADRDFCEDLVLFLG